MLTSPDLPLADSPDDDLAVWSVQTGAFVFDDVTDDRTHRATADGDVRAAYTPASGGTAEAVAPVTNRSPDMRKTLNIRVRVHLEPYRDTGISPDPNNPPLNVPFPGANDGVFTFTDTNGDGVHNAGEPSEPYIDFSVGTPGPPTFAQGDQAPNDTGDGRGAVASNQRIQDELFRANIGWAQAGIKVVIVDGPIIEPAPVDSNGIDILDDGFLNIQGVDDQTVILSIGQAATSGIAEVIFTGLIPASGGYARVPLNLGDTLPPHLQNNTYLFIASGQILSKRTLAHEIGHALTNQGDIFFTPYLFFPAATAPAGGDNISMLYRRIRNNVDLAAHQTRIGLTGSGNIFINP